MLSILSVPYALDVPKHWNTRQSKLELNVKNILFLFSYKPGEKKLIANAHHVEE